MCCSATMLRNPVVQLCKKQVPKSIPPIPTLHHHLDFCLEKCAHLEEVSFPGGLKHLVLTSKNKWLRACMCIYIHVCICAYVCMRISSSLQQTEDNKHYFQSLHVLQWGKVMALWGIYCFIIVIYPQRLGVNIYKQRKETRDYFSS